MKLSERIHQMYVYGGSTFGVSHNSRWLPGLTNISQLRNVYKAVSFTGTELKFGMVVAESHSTHAARFFYIA